jgi:hypothetical protein
MSRRAPAAVTLAAAALAAAVLTIGARRAHAKLSVQATGTATVGYTDNVLSAPDEQTAGTSPRQGDALFQLIPGAVLAQEAPRFMQRLAYAFTADLFARHSEANSYSNTLDWVGTVQTSSTTKLTLTLQSQQGRISTFTVNQPSADATVGVLTSNNGTSYFSQNLAESFEATVTPAWHVTQGLLFRAFIPIDRGTQPDTYSLGANLGVDRYFRDDALGFVLSESFVEYVPPRDAFDMPTPDNLQFLTTLVGRWRRDWSRTWNTEADLGVISIVGLPGDPTKATETAWEPSALAALRWFEDFAAAELHYAHTAAPNTLAGNTFATDEVGLQAGVPLFKNKVLIGTTVAYQHARLLALVPGSPEATADLVLVDATIGWQPLPELRVFARYALFDQFGAPPVGNVPAVLPDLTRNLVMVGVNVTYPAVAALRAPLRGASRVDETDTAAFAAPHAAPPQ